MERVRTEKEMSNHLLMMSSKALVALDLSRVAPFSDKEMLYFCNPLMAFAITDIGDERGNVFSLAKIAADNKKVFKGVPLVKRAAEWLDYTSAHIERYFASGKRGYIFFDELEQRPIRTVLMNNLLHAKVSIWVRNHISERFEPVEFVHLRGGQLKVALNHMHHLGVEVLSSPALFHAAFNELDDKEKKTKVGEREEETLNRIFKMFPRMNKIETKAEFADYRKHILMRYHPDLRKDNAAKKRKVDEFVLVSNGLDDAQETFWYMGLPNGEGYNPKGNEEMDNKLNKDKYLSEIVFSKKKKKEVNNENN